MKKGLLLMALAMFLFACQKEEFAPDGNNLLLKSATVENFSPNCGASSFTLFAGKTINVGNLVVSNDDNYLKVEYLVKEGYSISEVHLWVGTDPGSVPKSSGKNAAPVPGQFPYKLKDAGEYVFYIPLSSLIQGDICGASLYIYAHAVVGDETAWSEGTPFGGPRWGWYSTYTVCCDDRQEQGDEYECTEETGFGGSLIGAGSAWWYVFDTNGAATQPIYAGQNLTDATVTISNGTLKIDLGSWELQDVDEPVKVQGYNTLPKKRPAAGLFTTYKGKDLEISVSGYRYYVIHLDLKKCVLKQ